jgi:hypothetical protein
VQEDVEDEWTNYGVPRESYVEAADTKTAMEFWVAHMPMYPLNDYNKIVAISAVKTKKGGAD